MDLWWKGNNVRSFAARKMGLLPQDSQCQCERCLGEDTCRAMRCPGCHDHNKRVKAAAVFLSHCESAMVMAAFAAWSRLRDLVVPGFPARGTAGRTGEAVCGGRLRNWKCSRCDFKIKEGAFEGMLATEAALVRDLTPIRKVPALRLAGGMREVEEALGLCHWLAAEVWLETYRRQSEPDGELSFAAALAALQVFEWFIGRRLPAPPRQLGGRLADMVFATLGFLLSRSSGVRDFRVPFLRALEVCQSLLSWADRGLLETETRREAEERLAPYDEAARSMRSTCAFCLEELPDPEEEDVAMCATCCELSYCDQDCQVADMPRHRGRCMGTSTSFTSPEACRLFV